ncbi:hypothetical protein GAY28_00405 [Azospirillum brasilense]|nr:hypothetical protein [Azospirillum brasilense]
MLRADVDLLPRGGRPGRRLARTWALEATGLIPGGRETAYMVAIAETVGFQVVKKTGWIDGVSGRGGALEVLRRAIEAYEAGTLRELPEDLDEHLRFEVDFETHVEALEDALQKLSDR